MRGFIFSFVLLMLPMLTGLASAQDHAAGLEFLDENAYRSVPLATAPMHGVLPSMVDLSPFFPRPGNQGDQSSCVGWAVSYALKSFQENQERNWGLQGADRLFSPAYIYNQIRLGSSCDGGSHISAALELLSSEGVATLASFPYDANSCSAVPDPATRASARQNSIASWRRVNVQDLSEIKAHLSAEIPIVIGMQIDQNFQHLGNETYRHFSGNSTGGHAVVLIGYDDARSAVKIINSWGQNWGQNGYGWIDYNAFKQMVREGYVTTDNHSGISIDPATTNPVGPPSVQLGYVNITHNQQVPGQYGNYWPGMHISTPVIIQNASGRNIEIVSNFYFQNGAPLYAHQQEGLFRNRNGEVVTYTGSFINSDSENFPNAYISIPYYAFNLQPTNGAQRNFLVSVISVYLDGTIVQQLDPIPFYIDF